MLQMKNCGRRLNGPSEFRKQTRIGDLSKGEKMQTPHTEDDPYMLFIAMFYVAITEAAGRQFEADTNRLLRRMQRHAPPETAELCDYLLGFATRDEERAAEPVLN